MNKWLDKNKWLKDKLPKGFKKSKTDKGAYDLERDGIIQSIKIVKSDFYDGYDKWVIVILVTVYDKFSIYNTDESALVVAECSVVDKQIVLLDRWDQITHWELDDFDGIESTLNKIVLPWLNWFTKPDQMIDYLKALDVLSSCSKSSEDIAKYGSVLADKLALSPPRVRKYFNGAIASIYDVLGDHDAVLKHLEKHREFIIEDHKPTKINEYNDIYEKRLNLVNQAIVEKKM